MTVAWSYAATGLTIALVGLQVGRLLVPEINKPNFYRGKGGELFLGTVGAVLTILLFFFGFRLFWDNGIWGLLQLFLIVLISGFLSRLGLLQNGASPCLLAALGVAQAIKIF